jgi:hypothetical protein
MATSSIARSRVVSSGFFMLPCPSGALSFDAARQLALIELGIGRPCP